MTVCTVHLLQEALAAGSVSNWYRTELLGVTLRVQAVDESQTSASSHPPAINREIPTRSPSAVSQSFIKGPPGPERTSAWQ